MALNESTGTGSLGSGTLPRRSKTTRAAQQQARAEAEEFVEATDAPRNDLSELMERARSRRESAGEEELAENADPLAGLGPIARIRKKRELRESARLKGAFKDYPHLMALKPREYYIFHSDYFRIDGQYASILAFFHDDASHDNFPPFWGVMRIPTGLPEGTTTVLMDQITRMPDDEVESAMRGAERVSRVEERESRGSGKSAMRKAAKGSEDLDQIVMELQSKAAYLKVHSRLMVKAHSLKDLDEAMERISTQYVANFGTLRAAPFVGVQRQELTTLFSPLRYRRGTPFGFTSVEYAGAYGLVTNGVNDPHGEYVGDMVGDVNSSAIIFDVNNFNDHVVVADNGMYNMPPDEDGFKARLRRSASWGSKISQSALVENHRVVHLVMDDTNLDLLGPSLNGLTARLDMNNGDINMLEMFGNVADELTIFNAQLEKLVLMTEQVYLYSDAGTGVDTAKALDIIRGELKQTLTQFYVDKDMWVPNAPEHREDLRLVNIPHDQVPRLKDLVSYFETGYKAQKAATARDEATMYAYNVLRLVYRNMLENNTDLFNNETNAAIDAVSDARRVIYDFSKLRRRGTGVAMAQLVNTVGFAVQSLTHGDVVMIHGAENISESVKSYLRSQFSIFRDQGGRMVYIYNGVPEMVEDMDFNRFDSADYTVLGPMTDAIRDKYKDAMKQIFPAELDKLLTSRDEGYNYLRRGHTNVVFIANLSLGIDVNTVSARAKALLPREDRKSKRKMRTENFEAGIPHHVSNAPQEHVSNDTGHRVPSRTRQTSADTAPVAAATGSTSARKGAL